MADFSNIYNEIDANVNANGQQKITGPILNKTLKDMLQEVDSEKQDTLVAGQNIQINGNVISATGGSGQTYTAGSGIDITGNVISVDATDLVGQGLEVDGDGRIEINPNLVQEKLIDGVNIKTINGASLLGYGDMTIPGPIEYTEGDGIDIDPSSHEISVKAGTGLAFDANGYLVNTGGGGSGIVYTAGDGIVIDQNNTINANLGPGLMLDSNNNYIELDRSALNFLPLEGGQLQATTPGDDTTLTVMDGMNEDYVKIVAPETQGAPHVEIFENGSGDTKFFYDHLERGSQVSIDYPSSSGTIALTDDIPTPGAGLQVSAGNEFYVDTTQIQEKLTAGANIQINGSTISATDTNTTYSAGSGLNLNGTTFSVNTNAIQEKLTAGQNITISGNVISAAGGSGATYSAGQGINIDQNNEISVKASDLVGPYLGTLSDGRLFANADLIAQTIDGNGLQYNSGTGEIDVDTSVIQEKLVAGNNIQINGNVISATGGSSYSAGTGINIDSNNVISNTSPDPGLWVAGTGTNSIKSTSASTANGNNALAVGANAKANGNQSVALGQGASSSGINSTAIGANASSSGGASTAIGNNVSAQNSGETALGKYNLPNSSSNNNEMTAFTIGNGTNSSNKSNVLEIKANNDAYLSGVGGYTGTNASSADTLQDVINGKQDQLTAGSGISIQNNVISATGGGGGTSFTPGDALELDQNDVLSVKYSSGLILNGSNELEIDYTSIPSPIAGYGLIDNGSGQLDVDLTTINSGLAGGGLYADGGGTLEVQIGDGLDFDNGYIIAKLGSGLQFDQNGAIETTGGGSGLWTSGAGTNSVMAPGAFQANGNNSVSAGDYTRSNGTSSIALGTSTTTTGLSSVAIGANSTAAGSYSVALGHGLGAVNSDETALGKFNNYIDTGTTAEKTFFTVGNGTSNNTKSNVLEVKQNNDIYVSGVGGFDGTNASSADTLQDVIAGKQDTLVAGANITISGNVISATGGGSGSYTASHGIDIINDAISVDVSDLNGTGLIADHQRGILEIDFTTVQGKLTAGSGITISGNTISATGGGSGNYLPLTGGQLQANPSDAETLLDITAPDSTAAVSISADTIDSKLAISADKANAGISDGDTFRTVFTNTGEINVDAKTVNPLDPTDITSTTYTLVLPQKNDTIATLSDIQGSSFSAGTGINIDSNNVISNTAPDPGVLVAGTGNNSLKMKSLGGSANGVYSLALGAQSHADGAYSFAAGQWASASRNNSIAIGDNASSTANYALGIGQFSSASGVGSIALGQYGEAKNTDEIGLGKYNNSIDSGTTAEKTQFTVGNGTAYNSRSNLIEAKQNNDIYVLGIGGFDGTNASQALTLQTVINSKQNQLVSGVDIKTINGQSIVGGGNLVISGGSSLWTSGTGQNSLVSPGAAASSYGSDADGIGAIVIGDDSNANGDYSFAHGQSSMADGDYSAAFVNSNSTGDYSFAAGSGSDAQADYSVALGGGIVVSDNSDPENPIDALRGVAIGEGATVNGVRGLAFMGGTATGEYSVAMGDSANATEMYSTALTGSTASGNYSFAASSGVANAHYSTALSGGTVHGEGSLASGFENKVYGYCSAALGYKLSTYDQADGTSDTDPNAGEVALGRYNYSEQDIIFSIGCGYYDDSDPNNPQEVRENAITITNDGKIYIKGLGQYTGTQVAGCTDLVSFLNNL